MIMATQAIETVKDLSVKDVIFLLLNRGRKTFMLNDSYTKEERDEIIALTRRCVGEDYYAGMLQRIRFMYTDNKKAEAAKGYGSGGVRTAAVTYKEGHVIMVINTDFWATLTLESAIGVLKHECLHVMLDHLVREKSYHQDSTAKNISMDLAINEFIPEIQMEFGVTVKKFNEMFPTLKLPNRESYETYYGLLKQAQSEGDAHMSAPSEGEDGQPQEPISLADYLKSYANNAHALWDMLSEEEKAAYKERAKEIAQQAKNAGTMPGGLESLLQKLMKSKVNWKSQLARFVASAINYNIEHTRNRRNRRFGAKLQGYKVKPEVNIMIGVDTSGSVSDQELETFFTEVEHISRLGVAITLVQCDAQISSVTEYKKGDWKTLKISGRGGTMFQPVLDKATELGSDGLIFFTDGDCYESSLTNPKIPVLWALCRGATRPSAATFGSVISVE